VGRFAKLGLATGGFMTNFEQTTGVSRSTLQITHESDGLVTASFEQICVAIWNRKPTRPLFDHQRAALAGCVLRYPGRALFLCIVSNQADPPEQDVRDASVKMILGHERKLAGCACVIEGSGFRAAITRTVLTGMTLVARTPIPISFFDQVSAACDWLQPRAGRPLRDLTTQLEALRVRARTDA
jgi:hypothetical protein